MAQHSARAETSSPSAVHNGLHKLDGPGLGRDWTILRDCRLRPSDTGSAPTVLIHPEHGIAVLDVQPSVTPDAAEAVRSRLEAARFDGIFAGYLPVVHLRVAPRQVASLPKLLDDAFAGAPPLTLADGGAWVGVAAWALRAEQPPSPPHRVEPQPVPTRPEPPARYPAEPEPSLAAVGQREARRPRKRRRRGAGLRKAAVVLLCVAALGGVVAMAANGPPALDALLHAAMTTLSPGSGPGAPSPTPAEAAAPREAAAVLPAPPPARAEPTLPVPTDARMVAPLPPASPRTPPVPETPAPAATEPAAVTAPSPPRRPEAPMPQTKTPLERPAAAPQQQRRQPPQQPGAGAGTPSAGVGGAYSDPVTERCRRVASRIGSGAPLDEADMRFFNEACIRW